VSGAVPSSVSESAQASNGAARSSSSPSFAPAAVEGGVVGAGAAAGGAVVAGAAAGAVVAVVALGVSPVGVPPPPHPVRARLASTPTVTGQASIRIVCPPGPDVGKRPRIVTDAHPAVNCRGLQAIRRAALTGLLLLAGSGVCGATAPSVGDLPVLVVRASFPDRPLQHDAAYFTTLMDRLAPYYTEASSGRLGILPLMAETVVTLPEPRARYVQRPSVLASDAARAFVAAASEADRQLLERARALIVFFAGPGRESHVEGGDPGDPWSNYTALVPPVDRFTEACVIAEEEAPPFSNFGVLSHEFGHLLGLPELYAPGAAKHEGIGVWGLMGQGTWLGHGDQPPQPEAWSKMHLGWVDVETIDHSTLGVTLPAGERTPPVLKNPAALA